MTEAQKEAKAIADAPGFWPKWEEPTEMARVIQYPLDDRWIGRVINVHTKTKTK